MAYRAVIEIDGDGVATLSEAELKHLVKVRRADPGSEFLGLCLAHQTWYRCRLARSGETWHVETLSAQATSPESPLHLHLACALLKKDKMEWVAQKSSELGVHAITPLLSRHVEPALAARFPKQRSRLQKILLESVKQCGRTGVPHLHPLAALDEFLDAHEAHRIVVLDESQGNSLEACLEGIAETPPLRVTLVVGPEGGWSQSDRDSFRSRGVLNAHLGTRTLRGETACLAGVSILQYLYGDLKPRAGGI